MNKNFGTILSGVRATNNLHIGNFFGAVKQFLTLEEAGAENMFIFSADLHALTEGPVSREDSLNFLRLIKSLLKKEHYLYIQSDFPQIPYFSWIITCATPIGELFRMTQYKSKKEEKEDLSSGFLVYPTLMAADILITGAKYVPVGQDQNQHIEFTRNVLRFLKEKFQINSLIEPEIYLSSSKKIFDLQDPSKKMSKTSPNKKGTIFLNDSKDQIIEKIKKAQSDSLPMPESIEDIKESRPAIYNLCLIADEIGYKFQDIERDFSGKMIGPFKELLGEKLANYIKEINDQVENTSFEEICPKKEEINHVFNNRLSEIKKSIFL